MYWENLELEVIKDICHDRSKSSSRREGAARCIYVVKEKGRCITCVGRWLMTARYRLRCWIPDAPAAGMAFTKMQDIPGGAMLCESCSRLSKKGNPLCGFLCSLGSANARRLL
jgi:hypothetical protein